MARTRAKSWIIGSVYLAILIVSTLAAFDAWGRVQRARLYFRLLENLRSTASVEWTKREPLEALPPKETIDIGLAVIPSEADMSIKTQGWARLATSSRWNVVRSQKEWFPVPEGMQLKDRAAKDERDLSMWKCFAMNRIEMEMINIRLAMDVTSGNTLTRVFELPDRRIALGRPKGNDKFVEVTFERDRPTRLLFLVMYTREREITDDEVLVWAEQVSFNDAPVEYFPVSDNSGSHSPAKPNLP